MNPEHRYVLDTIEHTEILADASALGTAWSFPVEEHGGRSTVRIDLNGSVRLELPLPRTDFRNINQFSFHIATQPDAAIKANLFVECSSRTSGLPHPDSFNSGSAAEFSDQEGVELLFPYENFLIYGIPNGVSEVSRVVLSLSGASGPVWIGPWEGTRRNRVPGSRMTDQGLLAALDLKRPDVSEIQRLADTSVEEALGGLLLHLRDRERPKHIFDKKRATPAAVDLRSADDICENIIHGFDVGTPVDWRANPNGYLEWMHRFNRTSFFNTLLTAYRNTGEAKYARKLDELFASWIKDNPEPVGHNGGGDPAWETLSTACRIYGSWLECFFSLLSDANFSDATLLSMLKSFHGHAEHLMQWKGHANNWLIVESRVLAVLGMLFPEFHRSTAWREEGLRRLNREITIQIYPDGADWELSPGYHMMASKGFLDVYEIASLNGEDLPKAFTDRLPKVFEYVAGMSRPDGTLPSVNDSGGYRSRGGNSFLSDGARLFDRPEWTDSPEGSFAGRTRTFPDAGFHILAGGRRRAARWLLFDGGPHGAAHQHEDALSIELYAMGIPFLVDPGISGYMNDDWTAFYRNTRAHSSVLVNGAGQNRGALPREEKQASARGRVISALGPVFDFAEALYEDGYVDQPSGIVHRRRVVFVREEYYLVFDEVNGAGAEQMDALFHFSPMRVEAEPRTHRIRSMRLQGPNLELIPLEPRQGLKATLQCGETDPVQGWVADSQKGRDTEDLPAPVACYTVKGQPPLRFAIALFPYGKGLDAGVKASRLPKMPMDVMGVKLSLPDGRADRVFLRWDEDAQLPRAGEALDADLLIERLDANGDCQSSAWVLGDKMETEGQ